MAFHEPLTPFIVHCADPQELPVRALDDPEPDRVMRASVQAVSATGVELRAETSTGNLLHLAVGAAAPDVVRVRLSDRADAVTRSAPAITLVQPSELPTAKIQIKQGVVTIDTGHVVARIRLDPWHLEFVDDSGRLLVEQNTDESDISYRLRVLPLGRSFDEQQRTIAFHETFAAKPDEHFYGLGEKFTELDKRGQRIVSWNYDAFSSESERSYKNVPFYVSSRGYGVFVDSGMAAEFDLCHSTNSCVQIVVPDDVLDYYVIGGLGLRDVMDRYHGLTGRPPLPPAWAFGTWISTGFVRTDQEQTIAVARRIREHGIPCDVLHLDAYWQERGLWSHMRWDTELFPEPRRMFAELTEMGFRTCLWINPYISVLTEVFTEGEARGYFLKRADGSTYVSDVWHGAQAECGITDFTNPQARAWFQDLLRPLLDEGAWLFKTDFGEGVPVDAVASNGMTGEELHNVYALLFNDAVADVTEEAHGHRVVWARSSFTGGQRHCGQWAGDNNATFSAMASTLRAGLSYALSGVPFWSHDVGGFTGKPTPELYLRSAQFGAFSPLMRFHGTSSRFPWDYPPEIGSAVTEAVRMRYRLMPYLQSAVIEACTSGLPLMRPLVLDAQDEPGAWSADLEYLLGPDLLVAPVPDPSGERHVYLPEGRWIDYWNATVHEGGRHLRIAQPLERIPLFVRMNALIATTEVREHVGDEYATAVDLEYWGTEDTDAVVQSAAGPTRLRLRHSADGVALSCDGPLRVEKFALRILPGAPRPLAVAVNGAIRPMKEDDGWWLAVPLSESSEQDA
ncbi:TIM-barrel domain-containing protein [Streptomyces sp. BE230]|uniref:TIM-barrel domain-containing protein n=1 Tax=Streptomyces sp. BE230 TaxID=3002526 RepID=UPI002ED4C6E5|nr:TIM-barrel domain-containing protein [Streptomyces sp. BE230]